MIDRQRIVVSKFIAACSADPRVVAAFLGGSHATGTADEHSDLDLYLLTSEAAYDDFFASRHSFLSLMGRTLLAEDFDEFGFDMLVFILEDSVEGELALAKESHFLHIHGGPFRVLVDKVGVLEGAVFPLVQPSKAEQLEAVRGHIHWFWRELSLFSVAIARTKAWTAHAYLEAARQRCINLLRMQTDFAHWPAGYDKVEDVVPLERLGSWAGTVPLLSAPDMIAAAKVLIDLYRPLAQDMCQRHAIAYPIALDAKVAAKIDRAAA